MNRMARQARPWVVVYAGTGPGGPWQVTLRYPTRADARRFLAVVRAKVLPYGATASAPRYVPIAPRRRR